MNSENHPAIGDYQRIYDDLQRERLSFALKEDDYRALAEAARDLGPEGFDPVECCKRAKQQLAALEREVAALREALEKAQTLLRLSWKDEADLKGSP